MEEQTNEILENIQRLITQYDMVRQSIMTKIRYEDRCDMYDSGKMDAYSQMIAELEHLVQS